MELSNQQGLIIGESKVCVSLSRREENKVWGYPDAYRSLSRDEREERLHFLDTGLLEAELNFEKCLD